MHVRPLLLLAAMLPLAGGVPNTRADGLADRPALSVPRASVAPAVLADPDESVWAGAAVIPALTLAHNARVPPSEIRPTEVRVLWDPDALYVRFLASGGPFHAPYGATRDAAHHTGDVVEVFLDPVGDARQMIELQVSPGGGVFDQLFLATADPVEGDTRMLDTTFQKRDWWRLAEWDLPGLRTATRIVPGEHGPLWITDIAIPPKPVLRRLGLQAFEPRTLRANFLRYAGDPDPATGRRAVLIPMNWAPVRQGNPHVSPHALGSLELLPALPESSAR